jgi:hypothetical protein
MMIYKSTGVVFKKNYPGASTISPNLSALLIELSNQLKKLESDEKCK